MLRKTEPNGMQEVGGFSLRIASRHRMVYQEDGRIIQIEIEAGTTVIVYMSSIVQWEADEDTESVTKEERQTIAERIKKGLKFLGIRYELS